MKQFIKWDEKYNTGNFVIDHQHQRMIHLLNSLEEVTTEHDFKPALLQTIFEEVTHYTHYHFKTEEEIMMGTNFSEVEEHIALHREFTVKLASFKTEAEQGKVYIDKAFCVYLKDWWLKHIALEDKKILAEMTYGQGVV